MLLWIKCRIPIHVIIIRIAKHSIAVHRRIQVLNTIRLAQLISKRGLGLRIRPWHNGTQSIRHAVAVDVHVGKCRVRTLQVDEAVAFAVAPRWIESVWSVQVYIRPGITEHRDSRLLTFIAILPIIETPRKGVVAGTIGRDLLHEVLQVCWDWFASLAPQQGENEDRVCRSHILPGHCGMVMNNSYDRRLHASKI